MTLPVYTFTADERRAPPKSWCLPSWHHQLVAWEEKYGHLRRDARGRRIGGVMIQSRCPHTEDCPENPETMRAQAEAFLANVEDWPSGKPLLLDVYTLARNLASEFRDGTPTEKAAIVLSGINRARADGAESITEHLMGRRGNYGRQIGVARPASTAQDPSVADLLIASFLYEEYLSGRLPDITHGATHYLDRVSQDAMAARARAQNPESDYPNGETVYVRWSEGGDYLTWVGHVPEIRPWRLMLMRRRYELRPVAGEAAAERRTKTQERDAIREAGRRAILAQNRAPAPYDACEDERRTIGGGALIAGLTAMGTTFGALLGSLLGRAPVAARPGGRSRG